MRLLSNTDTLVEILSNFNAQTTFETRTECIEPMQGDYSRNLDFVTAVNVGTDNRIQFTGLAIALVALLLSSFVSWMTFYFVFGSIVLGALFPLGPKGKRNAHATILDLSGVIYKWNRVDQGTCMEKLTFESTALSNLYDAVYIFSKFKEIGGR